MTHQDECSRDSGNVCNSCSRDLGYVCKEAFQGSRCDHRLSEKSTIAGLSQFCIIVIAFIEWSYCTWAHLHLRCQETHVMREVQLCFPCSCKAASHQVIKMYPSAHLRRHPDSELEVGTRSLNISILWLRVVFPLTEPRKPPGRKSPKNGKKLQNSPPRSNPPKMGKNYQKITKNTPKIHLFECFGNFSPFSGVGPGRGIL